MAGYSPGWNDPPPLSFSQTSQQHTGKRNVLNKRVPFPLNQPSPSHPDVEKDKSGSLVSTLSTLPNSKNTNSYSDDLQKKILDDSNITLPDEEILSTILSIFKKILCENSDQYEKKRIEEINQRISVMKESWDSKISLPVKRKMFNLAQELSQGNADSALKIQCTLMVDNLREVKHWMVGVKHIIEMERQKTLNESSQTTS